MTSATDHARPCFCERCFCTTVDDLITERAELLDASLRDGLYADGYERELAEELIHGIPAARRRAVLEHVLEWDHLSPRIMGVDCLLDECDERTYKAQAEMTRILLAAIDAQDAAPGALQRLILNEIHEYRERLPLMRELRAARA